MADVDPLDELVAKSKEPDPLDKLQAAGASAVDPLDALAKAKAPTPQPTVAPASALDTTATAAVQKLRGTPVAPGMPTGVEQMGSQAPAAGAAGVGEAAAALTSGMGAQLAEPFVAAQNLTESSADKLRKMAEYRTGYAKDYLLKAAARAQEEQKQGPFKRAEDTVSKFVYQPRTEEGQKAAKGISSAVALPLTAAEGVLLSPYATYQGSKELAASGDPKAAFTAAYHATNLDNLIDNSSLSDNGKAGARILKSLIEIPAGGVLYTKLGHAIARHLELARPALTSDTMVGDLTLQDMADRLARGDTSVFPQVIQGVEEYGEATMQHEIGNRVLVSAIKNHTRTALAQIEPELHKILRGEKPDIELHEQAKEFLGTVRDSLTYIDQNTDKLSKELVATIAQSKTALAKAPTLDVALGKRLRGMQTGGIATDAAERTLKTAAKSAGYGDSVSQAGAIDYFQGLEGKDGLKAQMPYGRQPTPDETHDFLMRRANTTKDPTLKAGYVRAAEIATDPKYAPLRAHIQEVHEHLDKQWNYLNQAGVLDGYLQGYVRMVAEKQPKAAAELQGMIDNGMLQTNPSLVKQRFHDSYYRGEQLGEKYKAKSFDEMLVNYDKAAMQALADRNFIATAFNGIEKDDPLQRPILNIGQSRPLVFKQGEQPASILSLSPKTPQESTPDFIPFNHPAFKNWIWQTTDEAGKPVYRQGQLSVNPYSMKKFERLFKPSAFDTASFTIAGHTISPGKLAKSISSEVKGTALVGPFHGINIGFHAIERNVSPFFRQSLPELMADPRIAPVLQDGMEHGLMLQAPNMVQKYGEGLVGGGLWRHVPGVGPMLHGISEWTFNHLIPEASAKMYLASLEKNQARYSQPGWFGLRRGLTHDEISELTAKQVNNASGMQNDQWLALKGTGMFHSQTWLDMERLFMLAPEFLKARVKFTGEAAMPYMHEQRVALLRGALYLYGASRLLNVLLSDDHDPHLETPLGVKIGDTVFTFRNIPSDIAHGIQDPRSFFWNRVNPSTTKPAIEMLTGRDPITGRERDMVQQIHDLFSNASPRMVSAPFRDNEDTRMFNLMRGILSAFAISSYKYLTPAEKTAQKLYWQHLPSSIDPVSRNKLDAMRQAEEIIADGGTMAEAQKAYADHGVMMQPQDMFMLTSGKKATHLERYTKHLNAEALMQVWNDMDQNEKAKMGHFVLQKVMGSRTLTPQKRMQFLQDLKGVR